MNQTIASEARRYNHILSEIDAVYHEIAVKQGISDSTMTILYTLSEHDGSCLLSEIVRVSGISKQTINSALRKLEAEAIIQLEAAGGKAKRVCLTKKGERFTRETVDKVIDMENRIYASWEAEEWNTYLRLTERYLTQIKEELKEI